MLSLRFLNFELNFNIRQLTIVSANKFELDFTMAISAWDIYIYILTTGLLFIAQ